MNFLEQLKQMTKVVADTGDFESMKAYRPIDATTNPSLLYAAVHSDRYNELVDEAVSFGRLKGSNTKEALNISVDKLAVNFGLEILKIVPGRVSTEVDARLSFDTKGTVDRVMRIMALYESAGIPRERILMKVASTWEGIKAAGILEKKGVHCNLTLLFSQAQAIACAEAEVQLISPFVGRILDWHKKARGVESIPPEEDPGVESVIAIFNYYKKFGYKTEVMGASFRNAGEIIQLAGCDALTISPKLLGDLDSMAGNLQRKLRPENASELNLEKIHLEEKDFRWMLNSDAMATEKLAEGIRNFTADLVKLEELIKSKLF